MILLSVVLIFSLCICYAFHLKSQDYNEKIDEYKTENLVDSKKYINGGPDYEGGFSYNPDGSITLGFGLTSYGFYDTNTNKLLEQETNIDIKDEEIKGQVFFQQNLAGEQNYLLIVLIDYMQHPFIVEGIENTSYPFSLIGEAEARIDIVVPDVKSNVQEFNYIIVREPDLDYLSIDNNKEWKKMHITKNIFTWSLFLNGTEKDSMMIQYNNNYEEMPFFSDIINLSKSHEDIKVMPNCTEFEEIELVISNIDSTEIDYVLVTLIDWEQVTISELSAPHFIKIPPKTTVHMKLILPEITNSVPLQIIAFPRPFDQEVKYRMPRSTFRTIINKK